MTKCLSVAINATKMDILAKRITVDEIINMLKEEM